MASKTDKLAQMDTPPQIAPRARQPRARRSSRSLAGTALVTLLWLGSALPLHAAPTGDTGSLFSRARAAVTSVLAWIDSLGDASPGNTSSGNTDDEAGVDIEPNG